MNRTGTILSLMGCLAFGVICQAFGQENKPTAPLLKGLGSHHHRITTKDTLAQRFFDQGLILAYGFNHAEAERSFREAVRLDPDCAMSYWGAALVLGPNINAATEKEAVPKSYEAIQKALALADRASEKEQAYIQALSKRYAPAPVEDRTSLDKAYADAMRELVQQYPDDLDAATLFAEALMDLHPWDFWMKTGDPQSWTPEILTTLESVLERDSVHPGAIHFYIHAVEASPHPGRAEASADRLRDLVPGAGHLVHMPAHIYMRVGRYADASLANERAIEADEAYITQCHAQGMYPVAYIPHNHHFLWASTTMEGQSEKAIHSARHMATMQDQKLMRETGYGTLQHYWVTPLYALVRFGRWDEILQDPAPAQDLLYPTAVWHYARGMAFVRKGQLKQANKELGSLAFIAADTSLKPVTIWNINTTASLLDIAAQVLAGELAAKRGDYPKAIRHLETAVIFEDGLNYDEPPPWHYPVRQSLGAVFLEAGRAVEAEEIYREDLRRNPENGWSLFGLTLSLRAQGRAEETQEVEKRFQKAWARADVTLTSSRF